MLLSFFLSPSPAKATFMKKNNSKTKTISQSTATFLMPEFCLGISSQACFFLIQQKHGPRSSSHFTCLFCFYCAFSETWKRPGRNLQPTSGHLRLPAYCHGHRPAARLHQHHHHSAEFWADWRWAHRHLVSVPEPGSFASPVLRGQIGKEHSQQSGLACQLLTVEACT